MAKFRYYIVDSDDMTTKGTDDGEVALHFASSEQYAVIDTETGEWLYEDRRGEVEAAV